LIDDLRKKVTNLQVSRPPTRVVYDQYQHYVHVS